MAGRQLVLGGAKFWHETQVIGEKSDVDSDVVGADFFAESVKRKCCGSYVQKQGPCAPRKKFEFRPRKIYKDLGGVTLVKFLFRGGGGHLKYEPSYPIMALR